MWIKCLGASLMIFAICSCKERDGRKEARLRDSSVFFFDVKNYSRNDLARILEEIDSLNPKVIGLCVILEGRKDSLGDWALATSIEKCGKVILAAQIDNQTQQILRSDRIFLNGAFGEGVLTSLTHSDDDKIRYIPLFQNDREQIEDFANVIAFNYRATENNLIGNKVINEIMEITVSKKLDEFRMLDFDDPDKSRIRNKIVLMGPFSARGDSTMMTEIANIVLHALTRDASK